MTGEPPIEQRFCSAPNAERDASRQEWSRTALLTETFWGRDKTLTIGFFGGEPALRERVADLARLWLTRTGARLDFHFWTAPDVDVGGADIRIAFDPARGSWSWVGTQATRIAREKPTMNLGWMTVELPEDQARSVVLHEFGHAIGLIHEHLHPLHRIDWDRERVIADLRASQGWDDATISANMFEEPPPDAVFATAFDPSSIMMYAVPEHWTRDDFSVGWNTDLSASDIGLIQEAYGVRPEWRG